MSCPSLLEALCAVPDRRASNRRHPLPSLLALSVCAMMCGATSLLAIAEFGKQHGRTIGTLLGFRHPIMPCVATLSNVYRSLEVEVFEQVLADWFAKRSQGLGLALSRVQPLAVDGKTLRSLQGFGPLPGQGLVSAFAYRQGWVAGQVAMPQGDELGAVRLLLERLPLSGNVVTGDALLCQKDICQSLSKKKATTSSRSRKTNLPSTKLSLHG